jgi:hypothetical protein
MAFVSRDLMVNVLYQMAEGEGEGDRTGCTPSPTTDDDKDKGGCTPSPPDKDCTPSPPDQGCTPSPGTTNPDDEYGAPRQALASLRQQLRETLAQA